MVNAHRLDLRIALFERNVTVDQPMKQTLIITRLRVAIARQLQRARQVKV
jgi:hypothetical protein